MHCLRQDAPSSRAGWPDDLGGFGGRTPQLIPYPDRFGGFHDFPASVPKACLMRFNNNKYSVAARAAGRPAEVRAYANRIVIRQDERIVSDHRRSFGAAPRST